MSYLIKIAYDGSKFFGFQRLNDEVTVQKTLEEALTKINKQTVVIKGAGRTDRGVHANGQCVSFKLDVDINEIGLKRALNSLVKPYIYVRDVKVVEEDFHARFSVKKKTYIYKINLGEYNPIEKDYVFQYCKNIDKKLLDEFVSLMSGLHNFRSFTSDKDNSSYERDVRISYKIQNKILYLKFESSGFLRYMIRNIVGLLLDINDGKKNISDIPLIFKSCDRCSCGKTASGVGLYLNKIEFM